MSHRYHLFGLRVVAALSVLAISFLDCVDASAVEDEPIEMGEVERSEGSEDRSVLVGALLYLPNRVLDVFDIVRLRVRVGPGLAVGARATKVAQVYVGTYASAYAGLPGPRRRQTPKLPIGLESHNGASVSVVDATVGGGIGPDYSPTEFGGGFHLGIIGVELGIDPVEIADFATGLLTIDLRDDDL